MSTAAPAGVQAAATGDSLGAILRARWDALKGGDVGSLPVVIGLVGITLFFTSKSDVFFSAVNFTNLIGQMAGVTVIAIGVVFVLLIGEIDLSIGYVSGLAGVVVAELQVPDSGHQYPGARCDRGRDRSRRSDRSAAGVVRGVHRRAVVRRHARGTADLAGRDPAPARTEGVIGIQDAYINNVANYVLSENQLGHRHRLLASGTPHQPSASICRRRAGLRHGNVVLTTLACSSERLVFAAVAVCNHSRGVPLVGLIMLGLVVVAAYVAGARPSPPRLRGRRQQRRPDGRESTSSSSRSPSS